MPLFAQSSEEKGGRTAEEAGKLREALTQYVAALQKTPEGSADDQWLRETIIKLVQKLSPPHAIPEEARRFSVRAQVAIKEAKSPADFDEAAKEFGRALRVAPWGADGYINHGVSLEKAGKYNDAIRSLKLYLLAAPGAPDAEKIKEQIYALEYRQEKAQRDAAAQRELRTRQQTELEAKANDPVRLVGDWCRMFQGVKDCSDDPRATSQVYTIRINGNTFEIWNNYMDWSVRRYRVLYRGEIHGNDIIGAYIVQTGPVNCGYAELRMEGKVSSNGDRIELNY